MHMPAREAQAHSERRRECFADRYVAPEMYSDELGSGDGQYGIEVDWCGARERPSPLHPRCCIAPFAGSLLTLRPLSCYDIAPAQLL
jgi:hypothetical protein